MQEFSSISVSSYEAGALAERLTEQSRDGWSVVAIVPTGSTITAYLSKESDESRSIDTDSTSAVAPAAVVAADESTADGQRDAESDAGDDAEAEEGATDPTDAAPGWAAGGAAAAAAASSSPAGDTATGDTVAGDTVAGDTVAGDTVAGDTVTDDTAAASAEPAASPPAAAGAAPAGWYADPSSRFELRYWDGGQWTEHVSRAGQQYTDPPVA